jgi:putative flippase GtrA
MLRGSFVRFLAVGFINTLFSYGVYVALLSLGVSYIYANLVALVAGILFSFRTQGRFVFYNREKSLFGRFVFCWALVYVGNILFIRLMMQFGFDPYVGGAMAIPLIAIVSYLGQRYFVFRPSREMP